MKSIYLVQSYSGSIPSKLIKLFTKYKYSHISLSLDESLNKMYSFGRKNINNPLNGGFIIENIDSEFFEKFKRTDCRIYKLTISEYKYKKLLKILDNYENNQNIYKYDFIGLLLKQIKINFNRDNYYVCTHFIGEVISNSDIYNFNKPLSYLKPKDFEYIPFKELIYVGKIKEYQCL